jgi:hypothetical protein
LKNNSRALESYICTSMLPLWINFILEAKVGEKRHKKPTTCFIDLLTWVLLICQQCQRGRNDFRQRFKPLSLEFYQISFL